MFRFSSVLFSYPSLRQFAVCAALLGSFISHAQMLNPKKAVLINRLPASYVPDDDVIVKPVDNELSFYQQYVASDKSQEVLRARNQLKIWSDNQISAEQYGVNTDLGSGFYVPTQQEKWEYFQNRYLRYLRSRGEDPIKQLPQTWYQEYRASNEVDTIDEIEGRFKSKNGKKQKAPLPEAFQEKKISVWKKTNFIFQPRVDQGLVIVGFKGPIAYARAWVGVNGKAEINIQKNVESIGLRGMWNYYTDTGRYFTSLDKTLTENLSARVTSIRDTEGNTDNTFMLLYTKQF